MSFSRDSLQVSIGIYNTNMIIIYTPKTSTNWELIGN